MKEKLTLALKNLDAVIASGLFLVTMTVVIVNVFMRYLFNAPLYWGEEVATSCFVYTVFIGAAWCLRTNQHVGVDLLVKLLPAGVQKWLKVITDACIVLVNAYITYLSVLYINSAKVQTMPILKISSVYLNSALFIGFGLMTIYAVVNLVKNFKGMKEEKEGEF